MSRRKNRTAEAIEQPDDSERAPVEANPGAPLKIFVPDKLTPIEQLRSEIDEHGYLVFTTERYVALLLADLNPDNNDRLLTLMDELGDRGYMSLAYHLWGKILLASQYSALAFRSFDARYQEVPAAIAGVRERLQRITSIPL